MNRGKGYWFFVEPYVYVRLMNSYVFLYNTLDGNYIETTDRDIFILLNNTLQKGNMGVSYLSEEDMLNDNIRSFIDSLREKFMGDIIDVSLSDTKPIQMLPYYNYAGITDIYALSKKHSFSQNRNILDFLSEINIYLDKQTDIDCIISFLKLLPQKILYNVYGIEDSNDDHNELLLYLDSISSPKNIICSYTDIHNLHPNLNNNFSYYIIFTFPFDKNRWEVSQTLLLKQSIPFFCTFNVSSLDDLYESEKIIDGSLVKIDEYDIRPVYNGNNIEFFKYSVYITREDILSTPISFKDIYSHHTINTFDFGKISIMSNGEVFSNMHHPSLGNIKIHSVYELIRKELNEGKSWLRIRNQEPCTNCHFQWLCPSPSDYEIEIGHPNLCHVKQ